MLHPWLDVELSVHQLQSSSTALLCVPFSDYSASSRRLMDERSSSNSSSSSSSSSSSDFFSVAEASLPWAP
ncbi:hypothetical protein OPV22_019423 [Ensete ventricosum]|uniref:Uncharacterized protein n=1 Tax=Ensete ventricosum TaxID=4639 RepID=A0AAV8PB47_ENSVE|nr:hypothetical protein OPV22_019423 [Ensete ventricosum]